MATAKTNASQGLSISDLSGGFDDETPINKLPVDACEIANNVEFIEGTLGGRRYGCEPLDITSSGLSGKTYITHISEWFPSNVMTVPEFWAVGATPGVSTSVAKCTAGVWSAVVPTDAIDNAAPDVFGVQSADVNGKKFFAYHSALDRTHVYDGTTLRRTGLAQPAAPVVVDEGSGSFTKVRAYQVRYIIQSAGAVAVRSEPSTTTIFTPSSTGAGARLTKPAALGESETHWEVYASENNADFYLIATVLVGTTTYDDTTNLSNGTNAIPSTVTIPQGYVQLSNRAATICVGGTVSNGSYSNGTTFPLRGWVMYTGAGAYVPEGWVGHSPPVAGDVIFASQDVALAMEASVGFATTYAALGPLSEDVGTYLLQPSARYIMAVDDRLVLAGHWTDTTRMASVYWTPVHNDPGRGNDERLPLAVNNSISLDNGAGGPVTGLGNGVSGAWYVFKWGRIYKMTRTGDPTRAYTALILSTARGAVPGSVFNGLDAGGAPCIYFTDPQVGPCQLGNSGLCRIFGLKNTWHRVNLKAANIVVRGVYYPKKYQAHWWVSVDGADLPNLKLVLQCDELRSDGQGVLARGWSLATGRITNATAVAMLTESEVVGGQTFLRSRPFIGLSSPDYIQRCDSTVTTDAGVAYIAKVRSRPFFMAGLMNNWGSMVGSLLSQAVASTTVIVRLIRDFGLESIQVTANCAPTAAETYVVSPLDNLSLSEAKSISIEFSDQ